MRDVVNFAEFVRRKKEKIPSEDTTTYKGVHIPSKEELFTDSAITIHSAPLQELINTISDTSEKTNEEQISLIYTDVFHAREAYINNEISAIDERIDAYKHLVKDTWVIAEEIKSPALKDKITDFLINQYGEQRAEEIVQSLTSNTFEVSPLPRISSNQAKEPLQLKVVK